MMLTTQPAAGTGPVIIGPCPQSVSNCLPAVFDFSTVARKLRRDKQGGVVEIQLWSSKQHMFLPSYFWKAGAASLGLSPDDEMIEGVSHKATNGVATTRYRQHWHGILVANASFVVRTVNLWVIGGRGELATHISTATTPAVPEASALATAMAAQSTTWEWVADATQPKPKGKLEIYSPDFGATKPFVLAWSFEMNSTSPPDRFEVRIDATTGAVVSSASQRTSDAEVSATGTTAAGKAVTLTTTRHDVAGQAPIYALRETVKRTIATQRASLAVGGADRDFTQSANVWSASSVRAAVSAHWAGEQYTDWLAQAFGHAGIGDKPLTFHLEESGDCSHLGPGTIVENSNVRLCGVPYVPGPPIVEPATIGHELTHILEYSLMGSSFTRESEPAALEEAFSDILGIAFASSATHTVSWKILAGTQFQRDLAHPAASPRPAPDNYKSWDRAATADPHSNGVVIGHWFYLLQQKVGMADATLLVYEALKSATPGMNVMGLRDLTVATAETIGGFGGGIGIVQPVSDAWTAIGVDPVSDTTTFPADAADNVQPWNLAFTFPEPLDSRSKDEDMWEVELSTSDTFTDHKQSAVYERQREAPVVFLDTGTIYYWHVRAHHYTNGKWDAAWVLKRSFETSRAQPKNVTPNFGKDDLAPWPVTFKWDPVDGADKYSIELADDADFTTNVRRATSTGTSADLYARPAKTQYWRVKAAHQGHDGDWSTKFHSANKTPTVEEANRAWGSVDALELETDDGAPKSVAPADAATIHPWGSVFSWKSNGAETYQVDFTESGKPPTHVGSNDTSVGADLTTSKSYSWQVKGERAGDWSGSSAARTLKTDDARVTFTSPANNAQTCPWPAKLTWDTVPHATQYEVQIANDLNPWPAGLMEKPVFTNAWSPYLTVTPKGSSFFWRVRAHGGFRDVGAWSNRDVSTNQRFTPSACTQPQNLQPSSSNVDPKHVTLTWSKVIDDDTTYDYVIAPKGQPLTSWVHHQDNSAKLPDLAYDTTYAWSVRAWRDQTGFVDVGWPNTETFTTEKKPQSCNTDVKAGTDVGASYNVDLQHPGEFTVDYRVFSVRDQIIINDDNVHGPLLLDTDCTNIDRSVRLKSTSGRIHVAVIAHCGGGGSTSWTISVSCPP